jgi:hypothetical protein
MTSKTAGKRTGDPISDHGLQTAYLVLTLHPANKKKQLTARLPVWNVDFV